MRSDLDEKENDKDKDKDTSNETKQAVRLCRQRQTLNPSRLRKNDRNPSHAIHFTLACSQGKPEIDLSVYGTPTGISDDEIMTKTKGRRPKGEPLTYAPIDKLTLFGDFREELPLQHREDGIYHVYVFAQITRVDVTMIAVFAADGHDMSDLERKSVDLVVKDGRLVDDKHDGVPLHLVRLGQVARPELSLQPAIAINGNTSTPQKRPARGAHGAGRKKFSRGALSPELIL
jgi:hypothetical protein